MTDHEQSRLVNILKQRSLQLGTFVLASGKESSYYVDARMTTMSSEGLDVIGRLGVRRMAQRGWAPAAVGGLTMGADPVAYAIALASRNAPPVIDGFSVRKAEKKHGTGRRIEGCFDPASPVVIVEDVITSGGSALTAAAAVQEAGGEVLGVLAVVDRLEGGREAISEAGFEVLALATIEDLGVSPTG